MNISIFPLPNILDPISIGILVDLESSVLVLVFCRNVAIAVVWKRQFMIEIEI